MVWILVIVVEVRIRFVELIIQVWILVVELMIDV